MFRVVAHKSAAAARQYYAEGLKREDYYSEGQEVVGKWHGKAAALLGLSGKVQPEEFAALVDNRHPDTGKRITPRTKIDRTVGYDLNFHSPKSLSILYGLTGDAEILKAFRSAVAETMTEIERSADTRVRRGGAQELRTTGNLAWAEFVHFTARPVGGIPDPHLHCHEFVQNLTFDHFEGRWKAAMFRQIKHDAPYHEAAFHSRLAAKLENLGYAIERTKFGWELKGIPRTMIEKFSRRTAQIEDVAAARGITDPKLKDALGAATRGGKRRGLTNAELLAAWGARLTEQEKVILAKVHDKAIQPTDERITAKDAVDYACEKLFARNSVAQQNRLVAEALRYSVGQLAPEKIWRELAGRDMVVRKVGDETLCTTLDVLAEEVSLINFVRTGRNRHASLVAGNITTGSSNLSAEQRAAMLHVLRSHDQVIAIRGGAGVGKTTLMKEVVAHIESGRTRVFAFAPSAVASRETLREAGFAGAETVAHLLQNTKLQQKTRGNVIWIDEAGLLGTRELWEIMRIAGDTTRVILTGDSGQHAPVARGDAFRLLQRYAGLRIAEVTEIRRQEHEIYKRAVAALSKGNLQIGFLRLEELDAVVEVADDAERYRLLASDFLNLSRRGNSPLVVSPTHSESAKVTAAIRDAKRDAGQIKGERPFLQYHNLQWEVADKKRAENYAPGMVVQFHQNATGIKRGDIFRVVENENKAAVRLAGARGREINLPLKDASRFQVFEQREIQLGKGDQIRITRNGKSANGRRLNNGNLLAIEKFTKKGEIVLSNGAVLDSKHGHFAYGYCQTSHSSQSKSVKDVLVAQSEESFVASSREQFYVSASRGKSSIKIYTDNRRGLQEAVGNTSIRKAGIELAGISRRELAAMSRELDATHWRDRVQSRKAEGESRTHVQNLLKERRQNAIRKSGGINWEQYIKMRRELAGPDGKSRSKGYSGAVKQKGNSQTKGRSFLRPTELRLSTKEKVSKPDVGKSKQVKAKQEKTAKRTGPKQNTLVNTYQSALGHLKRIKSQFGSLAAIKDERAKAAAKPAPQLPAQGTVTKQAGPLPEQAKAAQNVQAQTRAVQSKKIAAPITRSSVEQVAKHAARQKAAEASKPSKPPQPPKVKAPTPPPPGPKR